MGSPEPLSLEQYSELETAGQLAALGTAEKIQIENGKASVKLDLPRQGVALLVLEASE
jgi:xylan 1,4-beta-xylosidase